MESNGIRAFKTVNKEIKAVLDTVLKTLRIKHMREIELYKGDFDKLWDRFRYKDYRKKEDGIPFHGTVLKRSAQ